MHKQVALELSDYLDSEASRSLAAAGREEQRRIVEAFLAACYEDLGKAPRLLDGHDVHEILGHVLPAHFGRKDPLADHVPAVLGAFFDHLETAQVVSQVFEIRQALAATATEFLEAVRTGEAAHHHAPRQVPVVHKVAKLGRNDPCSCGSGKKYKKCHGKGE
jgi:hypothetical protein